MNPPRSPFSSFASCLKQFVIPSGAIPSRSEEIAQSKDLRLLSSRELRNSQSALCPILPTDFQKKIGRKGGIPRLSMLLFFVALLLSPAATSAQPARADAQKDPILKAMLSELDRSMSQLQLPGFAKPFFIQYRIEQVDDFQTKAEFGSSEGAGRMRQRVARVTVRVGDYKTDSSGGRGDGSVELAALDDNPVALRSALWQATDQAYKNALSAYAQKQAELKQVQTPPQADDFSQEKPIVSLATPVALQLDESAWTARVSKLSGLYRTDPAVSATQRDVEYAEASFRARATTTWIATSEGIIVRKSAAQYEESFAAGTQAADGMNIDRSYSSTGTSPAELDTEAVFNKHAVDEISSLAELRKAPLVEEEYHGPLLMSADAATDTLRALLGTGVTATRPQMGTEARTNGAFASSFHARVLPDFMNVIDDPGLKTLDGKGLIGAYDVDDEGVPAQAVKLVDAGRLDNYLIGRQPVRDFPQSNGHGRAGIAGPAHPTIGVLKISANNGLTDGDLNQKLLAMARDRGLASVYFVETMGGPRTPRLLYRISLDGKRDLVRGAVLDDVDERALRSSIDAAGKDLFVGNFYGDVPTTVIAPELLFDEATVRRANAKNEKLPFYSPPQ
jgi:TldD protein